MMEGFDFLSNIVSVIITAIVTWAGTFLFYRQKRDSLDIENEARRSEEWRKLYIESQNDSRDKDRKIDELRHSITDMQHQIINLERLVRINSIYRCEDVSCSTRRPPIHTTDPIAGHYDQSDRPGPHHGHHLHAPAFPSDGQPGLDDPDDPDGSDPSDDLDR